MGVLHKLYRVGTVVERASQITQGEILYLGVLHRLHREGILYLRVLPRLHRDQ